MKASGFKGIIHVKQQSVPLVELSSGDQGKARRRVWLETARDVQMDEAPQTQLLRISRMVGSFKSGTAASSDCYDRIA